jgi:mycothiol system anti-sigma-R factor
MGSPEVGCSHVLAHLWQYLDEEIEASACAELEGHLGSCDECRRALEADRQLKQTVRRCCGNDAVPVERMEALVIRVRQRIQINLPPAE